MIELTVLGTTLKQYAKNPKVKLTKKEHFELIKQAKHQYYNEGQSELTDEQYDKLEESYIKLYGELPAIGAPVKLEKTKLPYTMGSQNKIKDPITLERWFEQHPASSYCITDKLDGISFLYANDDGTPNLYTRGDGVYGKNISLFIPYLDLPKIKIGTAVRGELIMSESRFEKLWSDQFANARNMVAGITNRKDIHKALSDVKAIAYEYIGFNKPLEQQLDKLKSLGFKVVPYTILEEPSFNDLVELLNARKSKSKFAIDGLVVQQNTKVIRNTSGNPDYAFAFKQNSESDMAIVDVISVTWNASRLGKLKPIVNIKPTKLQGVTISNLTAHNAKYVVDNKIGPGAKIKITRSGEVIPYIVEVVKKGKTQLPTLDYEWSGVDLITVDEHETSVLKSIDYFFTSLGIEGLRYASIQKLFNNGYTSIRDVLYIKKRNINEILGKNGLKVYDQLQDLKEEPQELASLLSASGLFPGISYIGFSKLVSAIPNIMDLKKSEVLDLLPSINGWGNTLINTFVSNFGEFRKLIKSLRIDYYVPKKKKAIGSKLKGKTLLFTGFRDNDLASLVERNGGTLANSFVKNLDILVIKPGTSNNKTERAKQLGIKVIDKDSLLSSLG